MLPDDEEKSRFAIWLAVALIVPLLVGGGLTFRFLFSGPAIHNVVNAAPAVPASKDTPAPAETTSPKIDNSFAEKIHPFLTKYCITCHNDKKQSGDMSLEKFKDEAAALADRKIWASIAEVLRAKEMPPKSRPQPTDAERAVFLEWFNHSLNRVDCGLVKDPGKPTIRRLNKAEYNNTIRDLIGVNFQPADDFPTDDVGYGFDNIGDVLCLSPILMEKYLAAADKILEEAIVIPKPISSGKDTFYPQNLRSSFGRNPGSVGKRYAMNANGKVFVNFEFLYTGKYIIRTRAYGQQAGEELPKFEFQIDDKAVETVKVNALEGKPKTYETKMDVKAGRHDVQVAFTNHFSDANAKDPNKKDRNLFIEMLEIEGPFNPVPKPLPESHKRIIIATPKGSSDKEACARKIFAAFVKRAYRRPPQTSEIDRLVQLYKKMDTGSAPFEKSIQYALKAVLVSPNFLFRIEKDVSGSKPNSVHNVSEFELASRLSYFLWSSMPDDELFALAEKGELRKPQAIEKQVKRMLADPKAKALTDNFASQWLNLRMIPTLDPDPKTFPTFDASLLAAMVTETELYFQHVAKEDRSVLEFLDSDWTFVNGRLAKHYGISGQFGNEFRKVKLPDNKRGGVITQASVLTLTSNPTRTSPVKRGKWILENILGTPPPPPPPNVPDLNEQQATLKGSLRQQMEQHRSNSLCASCHQKMDPLGFGLENFDAIGAWRSVDGKSKIDASGVLPDGEKFDGPADLRKVLLAKADLFRRNLAEKMLTFSLGRGLEYYDKCAIDDIVAHLTKNGDHFSALVIGIVKSDPFQKRRCGRRE